ncbi:MAG TPA: hypothetical protein VK988_22940 [Acidimicrobiales bacterium]|nr:hypothetical protein [Acidimicrobiales bacterium]
MESKEPGLRVKGVSDDGKAVTVLLEASACERVKVESVDEGRDAITIKVATRPASLHAETKNEDVPCVASISLAEETLVLQEPLGDRILRRRMSRSLWELGDGPTSFQAT